MGAVQWDVLGEDDGFDDECENTLDLSSDLEFSAYASADGTWTLYEPSVSNEPIASGTAADLESAKRACAAAAAREDAACEALRARFANAPPTASTLDQFVRAHIAAVLSALPDYIEPRAGFVVWLHAEKGRAAATRTDEDEARVLLPFARRNAADLDHEVPATCFRVVARFGGHTVMGTFSWAELQAARTERRKPGGRS